MLILSTPMCFSQENSNTVLPPLETLSHQISQETLLQMLCALQAILTRGRASQYSPNPALNPIKTKVSKSLHTQRATGTSCPQRQLPAQPSLPASSSSPCLEYGQCWAGKMPLHLCEPRQYLNNLHNQPGARDHAMEGIWGWQEPCFSWFQWKMWIAQHCLCLPRILNPIYFFFHLSTSAPGRRS